jgi:hypothetical protein
MKISSFHFFDETDFQILIIKISCDSSRKPAARTIESLRCSMISSRKTDERMTGRQECADTSTAHRCDQVPKKKNTVTLM